jgi:hypothetical protein
MSIFTAALQPVKEEPIDCDEPEVHTPATPATPATPVPEEGEPLTEASEPMVDARVKRRRANTDAATRNDARRKIMEEMVNCPECGIPLQLRCLAWRHTCTPEKDLREQLLQSAYDAFYKRRRTALAEQDA